MPVRRPKTHANRLGCAELQQRIDGIDGFLRIDPVEADVCQVIAPLSERGSHTDAGDRAKIDAQRAPPARRTGMRKTIEKCIGCGVAALPPRSKHRSD